MAAANVTPFREDARREQPASAAWRPLGPMGRVGRPHSGSGSPSLVFGERPQEAADYVIGNGLADTLASVVRGTEMHPGPDAGSRAFVGEGGESRVFANRPPRHVRGDEAHGVSV